LNEKKPERIILVRSGFFVPAIVGNCDNLLRRKTCEFVQELKAEMAALPIPALPFRFMQL
jgi:hypothetical protein